MGQPTVVTCLFDLAEREPGIRHRTAAQYLEFGELLLALDVDLICFADPPFERLIQERREAHGLLDRTEALPCPLEALAAYERLGRAERARIRHPVFNGRPKDTPLYTVMGWSKFELLHQAIQSNPFAAEHFIWADFGLAHVARSDHFREDRVFAEAVDGVQVLQRWPLDTRLLPDRARHLQYNRGHFAGGLISGRADLLRDLCEIVEQEVGAALADGFAPFDEQLLELAVGRRPELFSFHYGNYDHIIQNYRHPRGSADNLLSQLRCWRASQDWQPAAQLAGGILASITAGTFVAELASLAALLEECFLVSYYADGNGRAQARSCAATYAELAHRDPEFRDEFLRHEIRVRTNLAFVGQSI